jgi:hypothetical protein
VHNTNCNEDENPISTFVMNSLQGDIVQEKGACTVLDQRIFDSNIATCETINGKSI